MKRSSFITWDQLKVGALIVVALVILAIAILKLGQAGNLFGKRYRLVSLVGNASGLRVGGPVLEGKGESEAALLGHPREGVARLHLARAPAAVQPEHQRPPRRRRRRHVKVVRAGTRRVGEGALDDPAGLRCGLRRPHRLHRREQQCHQQSGDRWTQMSHPTTPRGNRTVAPVV